MEAAMPKDQKASKDDIIELEKSYWDAMKSKDGTKTAALSGKASLLINPFGVMRIANDKMGKMTEESNWNLKSYTIEDAQVEFPTADVAIIAYTVKLKATMNGKPQDLRAAESSTWLLGPDGWKCHAHSEVYLTDKEAA
jgi:ketosteroid isomerase-like protein